MNLSRSWRAELRKLLLVLGASVALGWFLDKTLLVATAGLGLVSASWLYQIWRMRRWLENPEQEPPEGPGVWGIVYDTIYRLQRENREARGRLQSTVDYLQSSFSSMRDGVVILSQAGAIEWCNAAAGRLLGLQYPRDGGQPILNLVRLPAFHDYFLAGDFQNPLEVATDSEGSRYLQLEITTFADGDFLLFVRDVTEMLKVQQMRRDFVGNVSHELRTPLTVFRGYLDTLLEGPAAPDAPVRRPLEQMREQVQRMENLLDDLLWLSRIESVQRESKTGLVDIASLLEDLRGEIAGTQPERVVAMRIETRDPVRGDQRELHSAISNLVTNALKYSADDRPVLVSWSAEGGEYVLRVIDEGIGIAEQHLPRLTERFYRVDESRSSTTGGTGLGLAIVKHVAASHGARLEIESSLGRGSTFSLAFPAP